MVIDYATFRRRRRQPASLEELAPEIIARVEAYCGLKIDDWSIDDDSFNLTVLTVVGGGRSFEILLPPEWIPRLCAARAYRVGAVAVAAAIVSQLEREKGADGIVVASAP